MKGVFKVNRTTLVSVVQMLCKLHIQIEKVPDYQAPFRFKSRDYWTRTSDLAPPRRVRYQLR